MYYKDNKVNLRFMVMLMVCVTKRAVWSNILINYLPCLSKENEINKNSNNYPSYRAF